MHPAVVALIVAAFVVLGVFAFRAEQKRRRLLRAWARSKGLTLHTSSRRGWEKEYPAFKLFGRGRSRHTGLHVEGEVDGRRVRCLDYRFTTGSGKSRRTHRHAVVVLDTGCPVIPLRIRPEHLLDKVGEFLGHDDIDFESSEFSRRFHVSGPDRRWAYDVIHTGTMEYLLAAPPVSVEFGFAEIAVFRGGALTAARCDEGLKVARRLLELVPPDVLTELKEGRT